MDNQLSLPDRLLETVQVLQDDPFLAQMLAGPDGVECDFKPLSQTFEQLELGFGPIYALEQQEDRS